MAKNHPKWNNKNSWRNYRTATNATIRAASAHDDFMAQYGHTVGGKSKGIGSGYGGMDALTAFQNIMGAHVGNGFDIADEIDVGSYYDLEEESVKALGLEGIPWKNGIYDKDRDGIDFEEEVEAMMELIAGYIAQEWLDGTRYIPEDVLNWAFYEVSDHNR